MKFVELHFADGEPIVINAEHIVSVNTDRSGESNDTIISFVGDAMNYVAVKESVDEVMRHIYIT